MKKIALAFPVGVNHLAQVAYGIRKFTRERVQWQLITNPERHRLEISELRGWDGDGIIGQINTAEEAAAVQHVREVLSRFAQVEAELVRPSVLAVRPPVAVNIFSEDLEALELAAAATAQRIERVPGVKDVATTSEAGNPEIPAAAHRAMAEALRYFKDLIDERKRRPRDDMISHFTQVELRGDDGELTRLTDGEIQGFTSLISAAGNETVTKLLGNAMVLLHRHPEQRAELVRNPGAIPDAVEECLRYWPPSQIQGRSATRDVSLHGRTIPAGARVLLKKVHDPERFGVATIEDGKVVRLVEKPKQPESDLAVTGIYMYDATLFDIVDTLVPSGRGELEITDVNKAYLDRGTLEYAEIEGYWTDAGTFESYKRANDLVFTEQPEPTHESDRKTLAP